MPPGTRLLSGVVVNCTGAWAAGVAGTAGVDLPVIPIKRQVFTLDTAVKPAGPRAVFHATLTREGHLSVHDSADGGVFP